MAATLTGANTMLRAAVSSKAVSARTFGGKAFFRGTAMKGVKATRSSTGSRKLTVMKVEFDLVGASYAGALVELARSTNTLEPVHADIDALASLLKENEAVKDYLFNPVVSEAKRKETLATIGKEAGFNKYTVNFLNLLVDQNRFDAIEEVCESFEVAYCKLTETQVAVLRSAVKLEQEQQFLIAKKLQELTGSKNIKLKPIIDETLIAGFIVEWASSQIDLSVKGQLDKITNELESSTVAV